MFSGLLTRVLMYAVIAIAIYSYVYALHRNNVRLAIDLSNLKAEIAQKTAIREAENKLKLEIAQKEYDANYKSHLDQLSAILNNSEKLINKEKAKNETLESRLNFINVERNKLRNQVSAGLRLSERQSNAANGATSERECDTTFTDALMKACAITTADFNACRQAFNTNCELTGCE